MRPGYRVKKIRNCICCLCCVGILLTCSGPVSATSMSEVTSESIREMENRISNAENEKASLQNSISDIQSIIKNLEEQKADLKSYVIQLDANLEEIQSKISGLKLQIAEKEKEIEETQEELESAKEAEASQYEAMQVHIRYTYERGQNQYLSLLLQTDSFGDFLNRLVYVESVAEYDDNMLEQFIATRQYVELCQQSLELEKEILDESKAGLEVEQSALETLIAEKDKEIAAYEQSIAGQEEAVREYQTYIAEQDEIIKQLENQVAEERKRLIEENQKTLTYDGGTFKFPLASYTKISDDYGYRIHPTLGVEQFHNGVDFAAPAGTAIYAAYDGVVIAAAYSATMGNYVMIDHGGGLYTIYMHASALYVSKDAVVARGDTIAAVGTTGRSTGNHLHFSVRKDGEYVSPWNYISQ